MPKVIPMEGKRFGRLVVIAKEGHDANGGFMWRCQCDCGKVTNPIPGIALRRGFNKSCGCLRHDVSVTKGSLLNKSPGMYKSRIYHVWQNMKARCTNPKNKRYAQYGGRGITVCQEWLNSFETFCDWAMANGYKPDAKRGECTIDRIDVNGNYCPENCRWATVTEQNRNTTRTIHKGDQI